MDCYCRKTVRAIFEERGINSMVKVYEKNHYISSKIVRTVYPIKYKGQKYYFEFVRQDTRLKIDKDIHSTGEIYVFEYREKKSFFFGHKGKMRFLIRDYIPIDDYLCDISYMKLEHFKENIQKFIKHIFIYHETETQKRKDKIQKKIDIDRKLEEWDGNIS